MYSLQIGSHTFSTGLISGSGILTKAMLGESLESDQLNFRLQFEQPAIVDLHDAADARLDDVDAETLTVWGGEFQVLTAERGDPVYFYQDNVLLYKMFVEELKRAGQWAYNLKVTSAIGLWITQYHKGGMYASYVTVEHPVADTVASVIAEILDATEFFTGEALMDADNEALMDAEGEAMEGYLGRTETRYYRTSEGVEYSIIESIATLPVNGHLPWGTKRDNLVSVLLPYGISVMKETDGTVAFKFDVPTNPSYISQSRIYASDTIANPSSVTKVEVTEHTFFKGENTASEVLYDTTKQGNTADHLLIQFKEPYYDITATASEGSSFVINESNCNYAIVTGGGVLTGKKYSHTRQTYTQSTGVEGSEKVATITNQELISVLNASNTVKRLVNYYANAKELDYSFVLNGEKAGDYVTLQTPYEGDVNAFIKEEEVVFSSIGKATSKLIANWIPKYLGNSYNNEVLFTEGGSWTVPEGVSQIFVILGQGGQGGQGGEGGFCSDWSSSPSTSSGVEGGQGGEGGAGGNAGKIYTFELEVDEDETIAVTVGAGGAGGAGGNGGTSSQQDNRTGSLGALGGHSTITYDSTTYTSNSGTILAEPYIDILSGNLYGYAGGAGKNAGAGGTMLYASQGESFEVDGTVWRGGYGVWGNIQEGGVLTNGGGGGAAYGTIGGDAGQWHSGAGATPSILGTSATILASGGSGGHAGGGGGGCMYRKIADDWYTPHDIAHGGNGSNGGNGANGFVLIYY